MTTDRFFDLLPGVVRAPGGELSHALRDLLRVLGAEADLVEEDIRQMYADLFIETCAPWAVPYIGDLVGYRWLPVPAGRRGCEPDPVAGLVPRSAVADAIRYRRRKGTRAAVEDLVPAVSGWPAVVCDGEDGPDCAGAAVDTVTIRAWRLPSWPLSYVRPYRVRRRTNSYELSVLGNDAPLFTCGAAPAWQDGVERPAIPRMLGVDALVDDLARHYGHGRSLQLYEDGAPIAPERIKARDLGEWGPEVFDTDVAVDPERGRVMFPERYELGELTASYCYGFPMAIGGGEYRRGPFGVPVVSSFLRTEQLSPQMPGHLLRDRAPFSDFLRGLLDPAVLEAMADDPATARARLSAELNRVMQAHDLAAGQRDEPLDEEAVELLNGAPAGPARLRLNRLVLEAVYAEHIQRAYAVSRIRSADGEPTVAEAVRALQDSGRPPAHLVVELCDSGLYVQPVKLEVGELHTLEVRAAEGCRPTIVLPERREDVDDMIVRCGPGSRVIIDGLMVAAHPVRFSGDPVEIVVRHCTFVPGWEIDVRCEPRHAAEPSLVLTDLPRRRGAPLADAVDRRPEERRHTCVEVDRSIIGSVVVQRDEVGAEPVALFVRTSIVDATTDRGDAIAAPNGRRAHAVATIVDATVIGHTRVHAVEFGENTIFTGPIDVARRQIGCLRYCYVPRDSRTPRRHACQPDLVMESPGAETPEDAAERVRPRFVSVRYGKPDYCRLSRVDDAVEIRTGADDASEMGVYHDLFEPRREANLRAAVAEHLPLGWGCEVEFRS
ncbi:hypothetical protein FHU33_2316 [Blastococcus colisei]|uniref:Tail protein P2 I n=1 Tax=Blastococcus colisei TaxID=1564162 RepID=A0A543PFQ3_9ACTN|nr:hypothetical protein [Blastococcus colisei]TQN42905.1 hypothetical protein FHU33_2316 [Blastococcus colisei]